MNKFVNDFLNTLRDIMHALEIPLYILVVFAACYIYTIMFPQSVFNYICSQEVLTLREIKDIQHAGTFSTQHNYYFVFTSGDTVQVFDDGLTAGAEQGDQYEVTACRGPKRNDITKIIKKVER